MKTDKRFLRQIIFEYSAIVAFILVATIGSEAAAFQVPIPNKDIEMRWDNSIRYSYGLRVEGRNRKLFNQRITDDGNALFDIYDTVTNRVDLLTEFDVLYKGAIGARISAQGWYDDAYGSQSKTNRNLPNSSSYDNNRFSNYTKRFYHGPSGEILDALIFTKFDLAGMPVSVKGGRHTIYWGEALLIGGAIHGISYSQMPLDFQKAFASPGVEAKELFRPLNNLSFQMQPLTSLTIAAQYFLQWDSYRFPEGGTYLGPGDFIFNGPDRQFIGPPLFRTQLRQGEILDPEHRGDVGVAVRWSPDWLKGTLGFYYRNYSDKIPQILRRGATYHMVYADDIDLFGVSLARPLGRLSLGMDWNYRRNTPLLTQTFGIMNVFPEQGETGGARGDTWHLVANVLGLVPAFSPFGVKIFDTAAWNAEGTFARWETVRQNPGLFQAVGPGFFCANPGIRNKFDGCATKNFFGLAGNFTPTWFQALPGMDLSLPLSYSRGIVGNSPVVFGGNQGTGSYSLAVAANLYARYLFELKYVDFFGPTRETATTVTSQNGLGALLKDRGHLVFTFRTTF